VLNEDMGKLLRGDGLVNRDKDGHLGQHANEGGDGVIGLASGEGKGGGQVSDKVHRNTRPRASGNGVWLEKSGGQQSGGFDPLTSGAGGDVGGDRA
jgi:hypothetical protein